MPKGQYIRKPRKIKPPIPMLDRFLSCTDKNGPIPEKCPERGPCWIWTGVKVGGYGAYSSNRDGSKYVHRWAYEHFREPVRAGMELHHVCENQDCCNPWHLDALTHKEHMRLHVAAMRSGFGAISRYFASLGQ